MPYYDFRCEACDEAFEIHASIKEKENGLEPVCPNCGSKKTRQMITAGLLIRGGNGRDLILPACGPNAGPGCCG